MSVQAMSWALVQRIVEDPSARHVLLVLANYAGEDGRGAFPATATLAAQTGLSRRTVQRRLDEIEALGAIERGNQAIAAAYIDRSDRRPVVYDLRLDRGVTLTPRAATGCHPCSHGVSPVRSRGVTVSPDTSLTITDPKSPVDKAVEKRKANPRSGEHARAALGLLLSGIGSGA